MATSVLQTKESRTRLARILLVLADVFPEIMQELLLHTIPPRTLLSMIQNDQNMKGNLNSQEQKIVKNMYQMGYADVDVTFAYKLLKYFNLIQSPTQKWGRQPLPCDVLISDDVERIHRLRNSGCHRTSKAVSEAELQKYFTDFIAIGNRLDVYLHKNPTFDFSTKILSLQTKSIDAETEEKYTNALEEIFELKLQLKRTVNNTRTLNIYYGMDFESMIQQTNEQGEDNGEVAAKLVIHGCENEEEIVEKINNLKENLNTGRYTIKLNNASLGSVLLNISIQINMLKYRKSLLAEVTGFIEDILVISTVVCDVTAILRLFDVILDRDDFTMCSKRQNEWPQTYDTQPGFQKKPIKLDVGIKTKTLESSTCLHENVIGFVTDVLETVNEKDIPQEQSVINVILQGKNTGREKVGEIKTEIEEIKKQIISKLERIELEQVDPVPWNIRRREEVREIKTEFEEDKKQIISKLERIELEQVDPVPWNIREQIRRRIDEWKIKDIKFICTRAYEDVLAKIISNNCACVAVTGSSGSGKSAIVRHISILLFEERGFDIMIVSSPMELKNYYKPGRKTLFVLEDVCGKFTVNKQQIDNWLSITDVLNQVMADKSCKVLLSCRLQVYKHAKFLELEAFKTCECNINSDELSLTIKEKKKFLKAYLKLEKLDVDIISRQNDMFPFLCEQYMTEKGDLDIEKYFNTPYHVYQKELEALRINGKYKLCALCLCVLLNNQMKEGYFIRLTKEFRKIVKDTSEYCGISQETSPIRFKDELATLNNTYIRQNDGVYEVYHDKLFDFMAYYFGQMMTQCFIDHADSAFIRERFLWVKANDTEEHLHVIENIVQLGDEFLQSFIDRMISDWSNGKVSDVFYNVNMRSRSFRKEFLKVLNGINQMKAKQMSNMKDVFREDFASGNTPLIISCVDGYEDLLKWLLEHKATVNDCRKDGSSALYMACQKNYCDVVKTLLENNANVNSCTEEGVSPLGISCFFHGNLQIISELLKNNAEVNEYRYKENNMTPLFMACQQNFVPAVVELLKHGADPNICLHNGMTVLLFACQNQYTEIVRLLIQYNADTNAEMRDGDTPLFSVVRRGFKDITEILLENGADYFKFLHSKIEIEKSLKETSQSLENEKQAWYDDVTCFGCPRTASYIKTKSTDYVFDVFAGSSPLHAACFMGHTDISKLLTDKLSSVDLRKADGTTPLFYACEVGHQSIVNVLLGKGADPNISRDNQSSPFTIAQVNGHADVLSLLRNVIIEN